MPSDALPAAEAHGPLASYAVVTDEELSEASIPGLPRGLLSVPRVFKGAPRKKLMVLAILGLVAVAAPLAVLSVGLGKPAAGARSGTERAPVGAEASSRKKEHESELKAAAQAVPPRKAAKVAQDAAKTPELEGVRTRAIPWTDPPSKSAPACQSLAKGDASGPETFRFSRAVKKGQQELIRGDVKAAHAAFCEASLSGPPSRSLLIGMTQVLLLQSHLDAALETAEQLRRLDPKNSRAHDLQGDVLIRLGRQQDALNAWVRAAGATRLSDSLRANLQRMFRDDAKKALEFGDLARADRMLRRTLALDPTDVDACAKLASVLLKSGDRSAARHWLDYAQGLASDDPQVKSVERALTGTSG